MKIPRIKNKFQQIELDVRPDGGMNLSGLPTEIGDSQATDLLNLWHDGKALRLRPGLKKQITSEFGRILDLYPRDGRTLLLKRICRGNELVCEKYGVYIATPEAVLAYDGESVEKVPTLIEYQNGAWRKTYDDLNLEECVLIPSNGVEKAAQDSGSLTWSAKGSVVYLFGSGKFLTISPQVLCDYGFYPDIYVTADFVIGFETPYVPTMLVNTSASGDGDRNESRNFLSPLAAQTFTTDAANTIYRLYDRNLDDSMVEVSYDPINGGIVSFTFGQGVTSVSQGGLSLRLDRSAGTLTFGTVLVNASALKAKNNLRVSYSKTVYSSVPVYHCSIGSWFGGAYQGESSGNRVFLAGDPDRPNRIYFSAVNDPSYFPDDAYLTVGDPSDPITAFGRQYDILAVLKKGSVYAVTCGDSAQTEKFYVREVHIGAGCDIPGSVQLIDNSLVWANTAGGIYTLLSTKIKDERAVRQVSSNINPILLGLDAGTLGQAGSADTGRCYLLLAGDSVFVWDYFSTPFDPSKDASKAQSPLAFYVWKLPRALNHPFFFDGFVCALSEDDGVYRFDPDSGDDDGEWFDAWWISKEFDFGLSGNYKCVERFRMDFQVFADGDVIVGCYDGDDRYETDRHLICGTKGEIVSCTVRPPMIWKSGVRFIAGRKAGSFTPFGLSGLKIRARPGAEINGDF